MSVTHPDAVRTGVADFVCDQIDESRSHGTLVFETSNGTEVATLSFSSPAFKPAVIGIKVANAIVEDRDATGGAFIAQAKFKNGSGVDKVICSVTAFLGGGDIEMDVPDPSAGQNVSVEDLTYEAMA